ncbi:MAG: fluoride efflux transporter CrcB [Acidobacteriota bacterium]|nr:fluoride efflux transporter CrcB [Acidobacteriota bacterium]
MENALAVGVGGFFGCIARYLVSVLISRLFDGPTFPFATFIVNIVGCLLIGLLGTLAENTELISPPIQLLLITGFLGGFTTYSAFGYQTLTLVRDGNLLCAFLNVAAHIVCGLGAVWLGAALAKQL